MKGGTELISKMKKAQSQIITTVIIILLVLAAVVIVWQVVNTTVKSGGEEVQTQSGCIGLMVEVTKADATAATNNIAVKPNKNINGFRVYVDGVKVSEIGTDAKAVGAFETETITYGALVKGEEVTTAGLVTTAGIGETWCEGMSSKEAEGEEPAGTPVCTNTVGTANNTVPCRCGTAECTGTNVRCTASTNTCSAT